MFSVVCNITTAFVRDNVIVLGSRSSGWISATEFSLIKPSKLKTSQTRAKCKKYIKTKSEVETRFDKNKKS